MKTGFAWAALLGVGLLSSVGARASIIQEQRSAYTFHMFSDVDGVDVYTHNGSHSVAMTNNFALALQWAHDMVVIPAIDAPPGSQDAIDAITTASRPIANTGDPYQDFVKHRDEFETTASFKGLNASYYVSTEEDWFAQMVAVSYNHDFFGDNFNLSGGMSYGWDDITPLADADGDTQHDFRNTTHGNLVATQILTPTTVVRAGVEFNRVSGLQHDPYRNVYVAGTNVTEVHPRARDRRDVFLRLSQYITNRSSIKVDYRFYDDDWGVSSHTVGGKLSQYITDEVVMRYRYRYYSQTPAWFFADDYQVAGGVDGYRTGDYRLGDYGAHLFGGRLMWFPHGALGHIGFLKGAHMVFTYEHYFNSNNFSAHIYEAGLRVAF